MRLDVRTYMIAGIIAIVLTVAISVAIAILGINSPNTKLGQKWKKLVVAIALIGIVASSVLGFRAIRAWIVSPNRDDPVIQEEFDYDSYVLNNRNDFSVELEYGEEFNPKYDENVLTLITKDVKVDDRAGEQKISLLFQDNNENFHTMQYRIIIKDSHPPKINGVADIHIDNGKEFSPKDIGITATDPVDGDLEVELKGDLSVTEPGIYTMEAVAVDKNFNKASKKFFVIVGSKNEPNVFEINQGSEDNTNTDSPNTGDDPLINEDNLLSLEEIAKKVIAGEYDVGVKRQYYLAKEGYNYKEVQNEVNRLLANGYPLSPAMQHEVKGETLLARENSENEYVEEEVVYKAPEKWYSVENLENEELVMSTNLEKDTEQQAKVNKVSQEAELNTELHDIDLMAKLVIKGEYGNGQERFNRLTEEGYDYYQIQKQVETYKGILFG